MMGDQRYRIPVEAEALAEQLDVLLDHAREAGISAEGIAVVLEDRAGRERRRAEDEEQNGSGDPSEKQGGRW